MKKVFLYLLTMVLLCASSLALAAKEPYYPYQKYVAEDAKYQQLVQGIPAGQRKNLPKVAVMYINNTQVDFYKDVDEKIMDNFKQVLNPHQYHFIDGTPYVEALAEMGIEDIVTAERADILDVYENSGIDYVVFLQLEPMLRKDKVTTFTKGKEVTATAPFKILDIQRKKALYNGRITRVGDKSKAFFKMGNKSVTMEAVELINEKVNMEIKKRIPLDRDAAGQQMGISLPLILK